VTCACLRLRPSHACGGPRRHLPRLHDFLWLAEDGMKMQGYNGSQLWDTTFAVQAIAATGLAAEATGCLRRAGAYIDATQVVGIGAAPCLPGRRRPAPCGRLTCGARFARRGAAAQRTCRRRAPRAWRGTAARGAGGGRRRHRRAAGRSLSDPLAGLLASGLDLGLRRARAAQVREDCPGPLAKWYRHISRGAWPFSTRDHGWPISDCSAEGLKARPGPSDFRDLWLL